jgi:hypothetical protein
MVASALKAAVRISAFSVDIITHPNGISTAEVLQLRIKTAVLKLSKLAVESQ